MALSRRTMVAILTALPLSLVSVGVPVYNGEQFIRQKLESLLGLRYPAQLLQILIVSDGANDGTDYIVE